MKKIIITGATGLIGRNLADQLIARGDEVIIFTLNPEIAMKKIPNAKKFIKWDYEQLSNWINELNEVDTIIHLAGINLSSKRFNDKFKKLAYASRIVSTRNLVEAIKSVEQKPKVFVCASGTGIYGERYNEVLDETSSLGDDFLANLCKDWEKEAARVEQFGVRRVSLRTSPVLINGEGALKKMLWPYKFFIGGPLSTGNQWFPWIHIDDIVGIYLHAIETENLSGAVNAASPCILRMKEFAKTLGKVLKRPSIFPVPKFVMKIAAGEVAEYAVMSQRVSVDKILNSGYKFKFENVEDALRDLLK
jgi:uncharacterized protein (TIGR01777 family)